MIRSLLNFFLSLGLLVLLLAVSASGSGSAVLRGKVTDADGNPAQGARVFAYDSPDVRRPGNYISALTDQAGAYRMVLASGRYWLVARLKSEDGYGPLKTGDKHSGDPLEIELADGQELVRDFKVVDLKEARKMQTRDREAIVKVSGRILDQKGAPVAKAYAIANRTGTRAEIPDYVSAWVDGQGRYTLLLPPGKYHIGAAFAFPPDGSTFFLKNRVTIGADPRDLDIVIKPGKAR